MGEPWGKQRAWAGPRGLGGGEDPQGPRLPPGRPQLSKLFANRDAQRLGLFYEATGSGMPALCGVQH